MLAFMSIFVVVMTSCISQSIISSMPIIFKSQAESINGQVDAVVTPNNISDLFNFTRVREILPPGLESQAVLRTQTNSSLTSQTACQVIPQYKTLGEFTRESMDTVSDSLGKQECIQLQSVTIRVIDSLREKQIGLGEWQPDVKIPEGQCIISAAMA